MKMIKTLGLAFALVLSATANAQNTDANVTKTKVVGTSADKVWTVIRKMDDIDKYSSAIAKVEWTGIRGVGGQRVCTAPEGNGYFKESIVAFDDNNRTYSYAVLEGVAVRGMVNSFKVVDLGYNKSMIVWTSNYEQFMENPNMTEQQFLGFLNQTIDEFVDNIAMASL